MASILIRNGQLVSALDTVRGDILVQDGTIKAIGTGLSTLDASTRVIDAGDLLHAERAGQGLFSICGAGLLRLQRWGQGPALGRAGAMQGELRPPRAGAADHRGRHEALAGPPGLVVLVRLRRGRAPDRHRRHPRSLRLGGAGRHALRGGERGLRLLAASAAWASASRAGSGAPRRRARAREPWWSSPPCG